MSRFLLDLRLAIVYLKTHIAISRYVLSGLYRTMKEQKSISEYLNEPINVQDFFDAEMKKIQDSKQKAEKKNMAKLKIYPVNVGPLKKPNMATWLSKFVLEDYAIGDLDELHAEWVKSFGPRKANLLYWKNILVSIWPVAKAKMISGLKAVGLYEVIRQLLF